ncbi:MAG: alginate lyase family protein [Abitibacteriaceae bacterium]|nr:alginate lyase family protein [Abditibacteriaceae bacterium]
MKRRTFLRHTALTLGLMTTEPIVGTGKAQEKREAATMKHTTDQLPEKFDLFQWERQRVTRLADGWLAATPGSVTPAHSPRSAGGLHDYFSEGDYWWPDPQHPDGPYIQRDGMSNPDNFNTHRLALIRLSRIVGAMAAAYGITGDGKYARCAVQHLKVWFLNDDTRMAPHLLYAQAIKGRVTGRGTGIIDTIHLAEVVQSIPILKPSAALSAADEQGLRQWFAEYLQWISTHPYGLEERRAANNHGTCWVMQAASFARFVGDEPMLVSCREQFQKTIVAKQINAEGKFPLELKRTKPYSYSLFNLDVMGIAARILSEPGDTALWTMQNVAGGSLKQAMEWHYPYIVDKTKWPLPPDVMYFEFFPVRLPSLLFASIALQETRYLELWKKLEPDPTNEEVIRNFPVRQPVLWVNPA